MLGYNKKIFRACLSRDMSQPKHKQETDSDGMIISKKLNNFVFKLIKLIKFNIETIISLLLLQYIAFVAVFFLSSIMTAKDFSKSLSYYLTIAALAIALSSVVFSYHKICEIQNKEKIKFIGELFLFSSLSSAFSLCFLWFNGKLVNNQPLSKINNFFLSFGLFNQYFIGAISIFCFGLGFGYLSVLLAKRIVVCLKQL